MPANWIRRRRKLGAIERFYLLRRARHTWQRRWRWECIGARSAAGAEPTGATARPVSRNGSAEAAPANAMLTAAEARRVQRWIRDKMPDQRKLPFALWTARAVRELIHKKLGKTLGLSTMPLYMKRWGYTAQKPLTRATRRDPQRIAPVFDRNIRASRRGRSASRRRPIGAARRPSTTRTGSVPSERAQEVTHQTARRRSCHGPGKNSR
jgi:transposase